MKTKCIKYINTVKLMEVEELANSKEIELDKTNCTRELDLS